jgi:hypothetical protein
VANSIFKMPQLANKRGWRLVLYYCMRGGEVCVGRGVGFSLIYHMQDNLLTRTACHQCNKPSIPLFSSTTAIRPEIQGR